MAISRIWTSTISAARALCASAVLVAAGAGLGGTAQAQDSEQLYLKFHVMALGMRIATLKVNINMTDTTYVMGSEMKTKGLADLFAGTAFEATSQGVHSNGTITPTQFHLETDDNKGERNHAVTWNEQRIASANLDYGLSDYRVQDVAEHMRPGVLDPLSAILTANLSPRDSLCTGSYQVFDGKLMYSLDYSLVKRDDFDDGDPGMYRGEAYQCRIVYRPIAGMSNKTLAEIAASGNNGEETYTVWMAPVHSAVVGRDVFVSVGAIGTKDGREFYLYLDHAEYQGEPLVASR